MSQLEKEVKDLKLEPSAAQAEAKEASDVSAQPAGSPSGEPAADAAPASTSSSKKKKKNKKKKKTQTEPPSVGLSKIFTSLKYPEGEICPYDSSLVRDSEAELKAREVDREQQYQDLRKAAEVHRQVRQYAQREVRPGKTLIEIADLIETGVTQLVEGDSWKAAGHGFPTGLSLNDCAAHFSPNKGDTTVLQEKDIMKVDFGVHVNGHIIDSAFTMAFDPMHDAIRGAVKEATNEGIKQAGIDARLGEIGASIQEVMESHEAEYDGKVLPIKCIKNLNGHNINPYRIHGGKSVPIVASEDQTKMEEGEVFAIETFASTGRAYVIEDGECSHYALNDGAMSIPLHLQSAKTLRSAISKTFGTLPFCRRFLDRLGHEKYLLALNNLVKSGAVNAYPPLMDSPGAHTAQYEHTLILRPTCKEVLSRGDDY